MNQPARLLIPLLSPESASANPEQAPGLANSDLIDGRIEVHDSNHFEVKLDYTIDPQVPRNRYRVEAYFFIPRSLGITADTYTREQFYSDIQAYIRFKTPVMSLTALLDATNEASPLARLVHTLPELLKAPHRTDLINRASHDMRMAGCLVRGHVRDQVAQLCERVTQAGTGLSAQSQSVSDTRAVVGRLLGELQQVVSRLRSFREVLLDPAAPRVIRETLEYVDEYVSLTAESFLTRVVQVLDDHPAFRALVPDVRERCCAQLLSEREHRRNAGITAEPGGAEGSNYVYRRGLLKKFVMSVLFLEISKGKEGRRIIDLAAAVSAGVAMLVATVGTVWAQQRYLATTWPFVAAAVLLYMVKDRLKDWLKLYFASTMTRFLADYSVRIHDPLHGLDIGRCREAFSFIRNDQVPREVWNRRHRDAKKLIEASSKPEVVMKYEKEITLNGEVVEELHGLHRDINDIIRFDISQFLVRTDDPIAKVAFYRPQTDRVESVECPKVYHVNVVFVLKAQGRESIMERIRVVMDKRGIQHLEQA